MGIIINNFKRLATITLVTSLLFSFAGCSATTSKPTAPAKTEAPVTLTISAAASLKDAMDQVTTLYKKDKPNVTLTVNLGGSGALETQIEQGAPADVFISAANKQMDMLKAKSLIDETTLTSFIGNTLVLVVPTANTDVTSFNDLGKATVKKIAIGEPKSVPAGQYALDTFKSLNLTNQLTAKEVQAKDVKEVLTWVETGNADAGIVYSTDAKTSKKVKVVDTAAESTHSPIVYPMTVVKSSANSVAAKAFIKYLSGAKAIKVFKNLGFTVTTK